MSGTVSGRSDSVTDCSLYLDSTLRARLLAEHAVQCCTIVQRLGDVVLIPAMSPYQVCASTFADCRSPEIADIYGIQK